VVNNKIIHPDMIEVFSEVKKPPSRKTGEARGAGTFAKEKKPRGAGEGEPAKIHGRKVQILDAWCYRRGKNTKP